MNVPADQRRLAAIVFTDMVGSTQLKQELGEREALALIKRHHFLIRQTLERFAEGEEIETAGDSFFIVFAKPSDAVKFALLVQSGLRALPNDGHPLRDRIGVHVGEVLLDALDDPKQPRHPSGVHVDTCARVMSLAQGDQVLLTRFAFDSARSVLRGEEIEGVGALCWMNHGAYALKGVEEPVEICEVGESGVACLKAPADTEKAHRQVSPGEDPVLGWRPALEQTVPGTKWTLERKLGEGGFGEVWLGRHETLKERRVFKFCFRADRVRALKREVTLFRVMKEKIGQHPNIVGIQEVFFEQPPYYIVMDYAECQDLRAWCEAQGGAEKVALPTRLEIVAQVADALQAAQEAGVIHRDVKPSNILIAECGTRNAGPQTANVKLTDFGIGQVVSQEALAGMTRMGFTQTMMSPGSSSHTGTQVYMAPELLAGQPASIGSDIYSLGVVLYQALIGDFGRPLTIDWAKRIDDPLLREDLEQCLAGNPQERVSSARDLAKRLRGWKERGEEAAARERGHQRRRVFQRAAVAVSCIVALAGMVILGSKFLNKQSGNPPAIVKTIAVMPFIDGNPDPGDAYLSDSLTAEVINQIRKVPGLNAFRPPPKVLEGPPQEVQTLLSAVKVPLLLQGNIQRREGKLHIVARLVGTSTGTELLSKYYDRDHNKLLGLPNELVSHIAEREGIAFTSQVLAKTPTTNSEAYDLYLKGTYDFLAAGISRPNLGQAIPMLERAVTLDTNFVAAQAALAEAYINEYTYFNPQKKDQLEPRARNVIQTALTLDPKASEAHAAFATYFWTPSQNWQHANAVKEYRSALDGDPYSEDAWGNLAMICLHVGLIEKGIEFVTRARNVNPLNPDFRAWSAAAQHWQGNYSSAVAEFRDIKAPLHFIQKSNFAVALIHLDQTNDALEVINGALQIDSQDKGGLYASVTAVLQARMGDKVGASNNIVQAFKLGRGFLHFHHTLYNLAVAYALLDNTEEALKTLRETANDGFPCYPLFTNDPYLEKVWQTKAGQKFLKEKEEQHREFETNFAKVLQFPELQ